jgi:hypothetical protein
MIICKDNTSPTKILYTNHPAQSPDKHPTSTRSLLTEIQVPATRFVVGTWEAWWVMSGHLLGDGWVIEQGDWYRESL